MRKTILFMMCVLLISFVSGATYENGTKWHYGNASFDVTYLLNRDLVLDNLNIYSTGIIINGTDNISFVPSSGWINITILNWTSTNNSFTMIGQNQTITFFVRANNLNTSFSYNGTEITTTTFTAVDSSIAWDYWNTTGAIADTTPPDDVSNLAVYDKSTSYARLSWTNPTAIDHDHTEIWYNTSGSSLTFVSNVSETTTNYTVSDLTGGTEYTFQLRPVDTTGNSGNYSKVTTTTLEAESGRSGVQGGGGTVTTSSSNSASNLYVKVTKSKSSINLNEPIEIQAETYLRMAEGEDEKINVGQVFAEIFDNENTYKKVLLTKTDTGTYETTIENDLPEGDYTLRVKTGQSFQDIPFKIRQYISNFGIFKMPKISPTSYYVGIGFVVLTLISVMLLMLSKKKHG